MTPSPLPSWGSPTLSAGTKIRNSYVAHMWAKWLHHLCRLEGPKRPVWGRKSEIATWPTCGQNGYITPAVLGVLIAKRGDKKQCLRGPHVGKVAASPLTSSWSPSPLPSWGGQKSEMAMWPTCGQSGYITPNVLVVRSAQSRDISPAFLGVPNAQHGDQKRIWLRGSHVGKVAPSPLPSWGSPTLSARIKIRNGYVAHMCAK